MTSEQIENAKATISNQFLLHVNVAGCECLYNQTADMFLVYRPYDITPLYCYKDSLLYSAIKRAFARALRAAADQLDPQDYVVEFISGVIEEEDTPLFHEILNRPHEP